MTPQKLAENYYSLFETRTRANGDKFVTLINECDYQPLKNLIYNCHAGMLPDDYKYWFIYNALELIADAPENSDLRDLNPEPEIYTHDLIIWLGSNLTRLEYCDQAIDEYDCKEMINILQTGYYLEQREVLESVIDQLELIIENLENGE